MLIKYLQRLSPISSVAAAQSTCTLATQLEEALPGSSSLMSQRVTALGY